MTARWVIPLARGAIQGVAAYALLKFFNVSPLASVAIVYGITLAKFEADAEKKEGY